MIKIKVALLVLIMAGVTSCNTLKKQERKANSFYNNHPEKLAEKSAVMFPNIIEGVVKGRIDTVKDIIRITGAPGKDGAPGEVRIIQTHSTDTIRIESGAKVAILTGKFEDLAAEFKVVGKDLNDCIKRLNAAQLDLKDMKQSRNNYRFKFIALLVFIGGFFIVKAYLKFKI